ncbi:lysozyme inhibitor LprI family protein [Zymobacter sp. IVIA_12111.31 C1]|uniref:lysozyme inhibitor LprI family protein n=1 Tax=Zymobacter sp. IVIA_12111.31 C1 TaxID=3394854 RepID=UPI0039C4589B
MALQIFKVFSIISFFSFSICHAREINSCYDEPYSYKVTECFNKKIESKKEEYKKTRDKYISDVSKMTDDYKSFVKKEKIVNNEWLKLLEKDCAMRAIPAGEEDGEAYNTAYLECVSNMYTERTESYKKLLIIN